MIIDYHVHTNNSFDCKSYMEDMCASAFEKGVKEICFTDHFSIRKGIPTYGYIDFERYFSSINKCAEDFKDKLIVKVGLEVCEPHLEKNKLSSILNKYDFDFILGSVHNILYDKLKNFIEEKSNIDAYEGYFREVYALAKHSEIDVLAHFDLLKRYAFDTHGNYTFNNHKETIYEILKVLVDRGIGIEINTSGARSSVNEFFPSLDVLTFYKDLGGEIITIGSDAHRPQDIAEGFYDAVNLLKSIGFKYIFTYSHRKAHAMKL